MTAAAPTPKTDAHDAEHRNCDALTAAYAASELARKLERQRDELAEVVRALLAGRENMDGRLLVDEHSPLIDAARIALAKVQP